MKYIIKLLLIICLCNGCQKNEKANGSKELKLPKEIDLMQYDEGTIKLQDGDSNLLSDINEFEGECKYGDLTLTYVKSEADINNITIILDLNGKKSRLILPKN